MILNGVVPLLNQSEEQILEVCAASNHIVAVDSFLPHLLAPSKRQIIVLWSKSDPNLFGYPWNINLLKDRKYLRPDQMGIWDTCDYDNDAFIDPEVLIKILNTPQIIVP
jgi:ADP-heptose:LPS heptosyltransferase